MYAVIKTGGKQLRVEEGQTILVEKLAAEVDSTVTFDEVVLVGGETTKVGAPLVAGATVTAKVVAQGKGKKERNPPYMASLSKNYLRRCRYVRSN